MKCGSDFERRNWTQKPGLTLQNSLHVVSGPYLGIDRDRILRATPALMQGLSETSGRPGDQARVQLEFVDAWLPAIEKYAGPDALIFMTRAVGANRQIALLFEPIVYEVR